MLRSLLLALLLLVISTPVFAQNTAQANLDAIFDATTRQAELLALAAGDISPDDGGAANWFYIMRSTVDGRLFSAVKTEERVIPLPLAFSLPQAFEAFVPDPLTNNWIDSDLAVGQAEEAGGETFRAQYPDASVAAALVALPEDSGLSLDLGIVQLNTFWFVTYTSLSSLSVDAFLVDAQFGLAIRLDNFGAGLDFLNLAGNRDALPDDARLIGQRLLYPDGSEPEGALLEERIFFSEATNEVRRVFVGFGGMTFAQQVAVDTVPSLAALPTHMMPSETAIAIAQDAVTAHEAVFVQAYAARGLWSEAAERAVWQVVFLNREGQPLRDVWLDAETGAVLHAGTGASGVNTETDDELPEALTLEQNYPNPFNPETVIRYTIQEAGHATLTIYDALGQRIRTLVDAPQTAGSYQIRWDARNASGHTVPSGMYLYRLTVGHHSITREMTLLR